MPLTQIALKLPNRPGQLARVARILAEGQINLAAVSVDSTPRIGSVRLIVSDPERAVGLLRQANYRVETHELLPVHLEDRTGSFLRVLDVLTAASINVSSVAILVAREGTQSLVALGVDDLAKARRKLREAGYLSGGAERLISNADLLASRPRIPDESVGMLM